MNSNSNSIERNFTRALRDALDEYLERRKERISASKTVVAIRRRAESTWLTVEEAVVYLGLRSRMALYQAVRRGQVVAHRFGRRLRFRRSELDEQLGRG